MFSTGEIIPSALAIKLSKANDIDLMTIVMNHVEGNWSFLTNTEKKWNLIAIDSGRPIYSRYKVKDLVFIIHTDQKEDRTYIHMSEEF